MNSEKILRRVKAPEYLDFVVCPACDGLGMVLHEVFPQIKKRKICEVCAGQGHTMSKATRDAIKAVLGE